jgi:addiction module RelE/StbE family toxin
MSGYVLHPEAFADLDEIREFIAQDNPDAAGRLMDEFFAAFQSLAQFPASGHLRPDLTGRSLRFLVVRQYLIVYAPESQPLQILAVLHGRRNPRVLAAALVSRRS